MENDKRLAQMLGTCHKLWDYTDGFCSRIRFALSQSLPHFKQYRGVVLYKQFAEYVALAYGTVDKQRETELRSLINNKLTKQDIEIGFTLDAISIVFYHSVFEAFVYDLIMFSSALSPDYWQPQLSKKMIPLKKYSEDELQDLLAKRLTAVLEGVRRESVVMKCRRIIQICKPGDAYRYSHRSYKYSEYRLNRIDTLRQDVVHGMKVERAIPDVAGKIAYLRLTAGYLFEMLRWKYKIELDLMSYIKTALR